MVQMASDHQIMDSTQMEGISVRVDGLNWWL